MVVLVTVTSEDVCWSIRNVKFINESSYSMRCLVMFMPAVSLLFLRSLIYCRSETYFSCDTVGRELWLAILNSLLCPETDRNIRIGKQGYVFTLPILRSDRCFDVSFLTSISVSTVVLTLGKVGLLNSR